MSKKKKEKVVRLRLNDKIANYREEFKKSDNKKIRSLNLEDIKQLTKLMAEVDMNIFEAAPEHGFNTISLGYGSIRLVYREPIRTHNVHTGEMQMSNHTPLFFFKPTDKLKSRVKWKLNEVKKREKELEENDGEEENI